MNSQRIRSIYAITLAMLDSFLVVLSFIIAYELRINIDWPDPLQNPAPLMAYLGLLIVYVVSVMLSLLFNRSYYIPRALSRVDQFYQISAAVSVGTIFSVAVSTFVFKGDRVILDYPRAMIIYTWVISINLILLGRILHQLIRSRLRSRGIGKDQLIIVGTGEMAQAIIQRVLWSPYLGYDLIGVVNGVQDIDDIFGVPILGAPEDLPELIDTYDVDEVIIAIPEKGHRETLRIISYCGERGRVSVKIFPDVFQFVTSQASIDTLGGLPLLSVRDYALRGYLLLFKRAMDFLGAILGIIVLSPLMFLTAVAIKIESPGPVFFIQERMGLDGKPFPMIKFRSMRRDAEKLGPGWTTDDDPRQTRLGRLIRRIEIDELPNLFNVLIGEMSMVGPRPEQAHYVSQFRQKVPRYMERHQQKGGMTGWAQVNGLRGDTSISERTKYDLWYLENWSIPLDFKIILRTAWYIVERKSYHEGSNPAPLEEKLPLPPQATQPNEYPELG